MIESVSFTGGPSVTIKIAPQRRRTARAHEAEAGGAAARAVQGRGARSWAASWGCPRAFVGRHPFPGPGLAIRVPGRGHREKLDILRQADAIYLEEIRNAGLYDEIWQAFAVLLPVRTVGVMGDARTYEIRLRAARRDLDGRHDRRLVPASRTSSSDAIATRIINEVSGINRVVYDITSKPPATIEWE